jgi:hypothetical protein
MKGDYFQKYHSKMIEQNQSWGDDKSPARKFAATIVNTARDRNM